MAHAATSISIGHMLSQRASVKLEVLGPALDAPATKVSGKKDALTEVTAAQLLSAHAMASPKHLKPEDMMKSVAWVDLNTSREVADVRGGGVGGGGRAGGGGLTTANHGHRCHGP